MCSNCDGGRAHFPWEQHVQAKIHSDFEGYPDRGSVPTYIVLLLELLAQVGAHADAALAGGSIEVSLARLPARRGET